MPLATDKMTGPYNGEEIEVLVTGIVSCMHHIIAMSDRAVICGLAGVGPVGRGIGGRLVALLDNGTHDIMCSDTIVFDHPVWSAARKKYSSASAKPCPKKAKQATSTFIPYTINVGAMFCVRSIDPSNDSLSVASTLLHLSACHVDLFTVSPINAVVAHIFLLIILMVVTCTACSNTTAFR